MAGSIPWAGGEGQRHADWCAGDAPGEVLSSGETHSVYCYRCREVTKFVVKRSLFGKERAYVTGQHNAQDAWDALVARETARAGTTQ